MSASDSTESHSRVLGVEGPDNPFGDDLPEGLFDGDARLEEALCLELTAPFEAGAPMLIAGLISACLSCCGKPSSRLSCPQDVLRETVLSVMQDAEESEILRLT